MAIAEPLAKQHNAHVNLGAGKGRWRDPARQRPDAFAALALAGLLVGSVVAAVSGDQAPPADGEVRIIRDSFTNDTITTLTLMLQGPKAKPLPINMVMTVVRRARARVADPLAMRLDLFMPRYVGPLDSNPPHVVFVLDRGTKDEQSVAFSVDSTVPIIGTIDSVSVPFDAGALARLGKATTINGRLFGIAFELTAKQLTAVRGLPSRLR